MRTWDRGTIELRLTGELTVRSAADVRLLLHHALDDGCAELVLDLSGVDRADRTGLGVLVGAHRRAGRLGSRLVLRNVPASLDRLLVVTRLRRILNVEYAVAA